MSDTIITAVRKFIRDLMDIEESQILDARANHPRGNNDDDLIVVDQLGADRALASGADFDGDTEVMTYSERASRSVTVDFYGPSAPARILKFRMLIRSQLAQELQETLGITVWHASGIADVKALTGAQFGNRLQIEFKVHYSPFEAIDTLRIDTAGVEVLTETGTTEIETEA